METTSIDIINHISQFLSPVDCESLRRTCSRFWYGVNKTNTTNKFKIFLQSKLGDDIDVEEFLQDILNYGIIISGSFMVKFLYYDTFVENDIDLFKPTTNFHETNKIFTKYGFVRDKISTRKNSDNFSPVYFKKDKLKNKIKLNIISFSNITPLQIITNHFDMDICKVMFYKNRVWVYDYNKMIYRKDTIKPITDKIIKCYLLFALAPTMTEILKRMNRRREKYLNRGFDISFIDDFEKIAYKTAKSFEKNRNNPDDYITHYNYEITKEISKMIKKINYKLKKSNVVQISSKKFAFTKYQLQRIGESSFDNVHYKVSVYHNLLFIEKRSLVVNDDVFAECLGEAKSFLINY